MDPMFCPNDIYVTWDQIKSKLTSLAKFWSVYGMFTWYQTGMTVVNF